MNAVIALVVLLAATDYRAVVQQAEELVAAKSHAKAVELLAAQLKTCEAGDAGKPCRAHVYFALGYVYGAMGDGASLERAVRSYGYMLREYPGHAAALANRAALQAQRGQTADAATTYEEAATGAANKALAAEYWLAAAEQLRGVDSGRGLAYERIIANYRRAVASGSADAPERLISLMSSWIANAASPDEARSRIGITLETLDEQAARGEVSIVIDGYVAIMSQHAVAPSAAMHALAGWIEIRAATHSLTPAALAELPKAWNAPLLRGMVATIESGKWTFDANLTSVLDRRAAAIVGHTTGDRLIAAKNLKGAHELYVAALDAAPVPAEQDSDRSFNTRPVPFFDLALQLARMATFQKDEALFREVEKRLFESKFQAYRTRNVAAAQRLHTILGTLYVERGTWTGSGYANAKFQLARAIESAEQLGRESGRVQPLPQLRTWLAEAHRKNGDGEQARRQELIAAQEYMSLHALKPARQSLARARTDATPEQLASIERLEKIADFTERPPWMTTTVGGTKIPRFFAMDPAFGKQIVVSAWVDEEFIKCPIMSFAPPPKPRQAHR
ncbi:MAG TPA: hypothetical protein VF698_03540 [Thermoanaerobaculia bacterium]|jgi:tetratricopeptide (TPR) repeat protein